MFCGLNKFAKATTYFSKRKNCLLNNFTRTMNEGICGMKPLRMRLRPWDFDSLPIWLKTKENTCNKPYFHGSGAWITFQVPGSGYRPIRSRRSASSAMATVEQRAARAAFSGTMDVDGSPGGIPVPESPELASGPEGDPKTQFGHLDFPTW